MQTVHRPPGGAPEDEDRVGPERPSACPRRSPTASTGVQRLPGEWLRLSHGVGDDIIADGQAEVTRAGRRSKVGWTEQTIPHPWWSGMTKGC